MQIYGKLKFLFRVFMASGVFFEIVNNQYPEVSKNSYKKVTRVVDW